MRVHISGEDIGRELRDRGLTEPTGDDWGDSVAAAIKELGEAQRTREKVATEEAIRVAAETNSGRVQALRMQIATDSQEAVDRELDAILARVQGKGR